MARNRKYFVHNTTLLVTSRIEEGLPLVPTHFLNEIIWGILARGQALYPVRICHFVFMANHFHMLLVVHNPEDVSRYTGYIKGEITHAVNRLLGRRKKSIWDKGYDSPVVLTPDDVIRYINYIYTNPTKPGLVDSMDDYPGVSSWEMFQQEKHVRACKHFSRESVPLLSHPAYGVNEQKRIADVLLSSKTPGTREWLKLEPYAWVECFPELGFITEHSGLREKITTAVRKDEALFKSRRTSDRKFAAGSTALRRQSMLKEHSPKKHSRRMICLSSDIPLRAKFIGHFKALCQTAAEVYRKWKHGVTSLRMPPGILAPRMPVLASVLLTVT